MQVASKFQKQLLEATRQCFIDNPLSVATERAFWQTPRHLFVKRYRLGASNEWYDIDADNLAQHLPSIYRDGVLILLGDDDDDVPSTISQPSLVLFMLDMLKLEPGQTVFELGAGSGWNAALIGNIVGPTGKVYSLEIIPEIAESAVHTIQSLGIENVHIICGDGGAGYAPAAPYDRAIFTAGSYDIPHHFYEQIKETGLLLVVIKNEGGGDALFLLEKREDHFESITALPCSFVKMTGQYCLDSLEPMALTTLPEWRELKDQEISRIPFWWGGKGFGFVWRTLSIRSFLSITEPLYCSFRVERTKQLYAEEQFFGLWDKDNRSLVIAKDDLIIAYGSPLAKDRLMQQIRHWVELGMPGSVSFNLRVYPIDYHLSVGINQWIVKRRESQFLWSLNL
ncbi:MAG: protein-L-isoaspartate O-methyltransferase [Acidobacteriota bacterium]